MARAAGMREQYVLLVLVVLGGLIFTLGCLMIAYGLAIIGYPACAPQHVVVVRDLLRNM